MTNNKTKNHGNREEQRPSTQKPEQGQSRVQSKNYPASQGRTGYTLEEAPAPREEAAP